MQTGMLWFDNSELTLQQKIEKAIAYYEKKHGRKPELCLIHPSIIPVDGVQVEIEGLVIKSYKYIVPGHLWVGIEEMPTGEPSHDKDSNKKI